MDTQFGGCLFADMCAYETNCNAVSPALFILRVPSLNMGEMTYFNQNMLIYAIYVNEGVFK